MPQTTANSASQSGIPALLARNMTHHYNWIWVPYSSPLRDGPVIPGRCGVSTAATHHVPLPCWSWLASLRGVADESSACVPVHAITNPLLNLAW